jgi:hypothetical protein
LFGIKEDRGMAKGSHRRPDKGKKKGLKNSDEVKDLQRVKDREREDRKSKNLIRQLRGKRWNEEEFDEELENEIR